MINKEKNKLIEEQKIAATFFIIALVLMLYLLNEKQNQNIKTHANNADTKQLALFNKVLILCIYLSFLYISYVSYQKSGSSTDEVAVIAAVIAVIPPIIMLYAYYLAQNDSTTMNPLL